MRCRLLKAPLHDDDATSVDLTYCDEETKRRAWEIFIHPTGSNRLIIPPLMLYMCICRPPSRYPFSGTCMHHAAKPSLSAAGKGR